MPLENSALQQLHKQEFKAERDEIAENTTRERAQYFQEKQILLDKQKTLALKLFEKQLELKNFQQEELEFSNKLTSRFETIQSKILSKFGEDKRHKYLEGRVEIAQTTVGQLEIDIRNLESEIQENNASLEQIVENKNNLKNKIETFYDETSYDFLTPEQKKELFKADNLKKLNTAEYMELWRAGSPYFLAHVTRQGFRDHFSMMWHSGGINTFQEGLVNVLSDEKSLQSPFYINGLRLDDEDKFTEVLQNANILSKQTPEEALMAFENFINFGLADAPKFADKTAIHLSAESVLDSHYGGERGNETFFIFPADFIASQHSFAFNGKEKDFTKRQSEKTWNDVFVWANDGINLDAGLVFLPEKTAVDPKTGSKYASKEAADGSLTMIEDPEAINKLQQWWTKNKLLFKEMWDNAQDSDFYSSGREKQYFWDSVFFKLKDLGYQADVLDGEAAAILTSNLSNSTEELSPEDINTFLQASNLKFALPEKTVPAKEYWENYFSTHPDQKPKHIIYYNGNPTDAISEFLESENITPKKDNPPLLGFDDNHVTDMKNDPRANPHYEETISMAKKLIDRHFKNNNY